MGGLTKSQTMILILAAAVVLVFSVIWRGCGRRPAEFSSVRTLAMAGPDENPASYHHEPFGLVADDDGNIYFSESVTGRIYRIPHQGYLAGAASQGESVRVEGLESPSAMAFDGDGNLVVANTGAHTIVRVNVGDGSAEVIAGTSGASGWNDGPARQALFNGPVGLAVSGDGTIYVADTYNDRIRVVTSDGQVKTIAGGAGPGYRDGAGSEALFDTPCGVAVAPDGSLLVADTGNHRIRRVEPDGRVTTIAGQDSPDGSQGDIEEPVAMAIRDRNSFYVADYGRSRIHLVTTGGSPSVATIAGGDLPGLRDGGMKEAALNRPAGMAVLPGGELAFADSANGMIRALAPRGSRAGRIQDPASRVIGPAGLRKLLEPRWPFDPPLNVRDIAGTFGEIRGEQQPDGFAWFHSGLDIAGAYGEPVHAMYSERISAPLAPNDTAGIRERFRTPLFEYIHLRIGRDRNDEPIGSFPAGAVTFLRDSEGRVYRVRMRRGTRISAGDVIGTLNRLNHVHLITGPPGFEFNGMAALKLPNLSDTIPPVIERVTITGEDGKAIYQSDGKVKERGRLSATGRVRMLMQAYDRVDSNPKNRRLGLYRVGYQVLRPDGSAIPAFREPLYTIVFDRLPLDLEASRLAYAPGSRSGYEGGTVFEYIVTNLVGGGRSAESFLDLDSLPPGEFLLRLLAEDYFGNQSRFELLLNN